MKRVAAVSTVFLSIVLLGATAFAYPPQEEKNQKQGQPEKQAEPKQQEQHAQQQQQNQNRQQAQQQNQNKQQEQHAQQQQQNQNRQQAQQQQQNRTQHAQIQRTQQQQRTQQVAQRNDWRQHRANNWSSEHRDWQQRGGYNGYRIPDAYFGSYYGQDHFFRVYSLPFMVVGGFPRFQYGGYWFSVLDPYPDYWGDDWYETDDVYVAYVDNGYYLFDRSYPGRPGVAISISL